MSENYIMPLMEKLNSRQKNRLIDLMSRHYNILFGRFVSADGALVKSRIWQRIHTELNCLGPKKSRDQWKKCWRDLKKTAKSKLFKITKYRQKSGGGGDTCPIFITDQEEMIISICNFNKLKELQGQELGINQTPCRPPYQNRSVGYVSPSNDESFRGFNNGMHCQSPTISVSSNDSSMSKSRSQSGSKNNSRRDTSESSDISLDRQSVSTVRPTVSASSNDSSMSKNRSQSGSKNHLYRRRDTTDSSDIPVDRQSATIVRIPESNGTGRGDPTTPIRPVVSEVRDRSKFFTSTPLRALRGQAWSVWSSFRGETIDLTNQEEFPESHHLNTSLTRNRSIHQSRSKKRANNENRLSKSNVGDCRYVSTSISSWSENSLMLTSNKMKRSNCSGNHRSIRSRSRSRSTSRSTSRTVRTSGNNRSVLSSITGDSGHSLSNQSSNRYISHQNSLSKSNRSSHSGRCPLKGILNSGIPYKNENSGRHSPRNERVHRNRCEVHCESNRSIGYGSFSSMSIASSRHSDRSSSLHHSNVSNRQCSSNCSCIYRSNSMVSSRNMQSDPDRESRRNLTGTLARSVQNAGLIQENIERNIFQLRDGQSDIISVLEECLNELRRSNDLRNQ